ncbi:MAG: hypothetical protein ACLT9Y_01085 [Peptostreptococcus anaerobius]
MNKKLGKNGIFFWLFLAPVLIALFMVVVIPLLYGVYYSFTNWDGINTPQFAGVTNYIQLLGDKVLEILFGSLLSLLLYQLF